MSHEETKRLATLCVPAVMLLSCHKGSDEHGPKGDTHHEAHAAEEAPRGHDHDHDRPSDLERSAQELFALGCEHQRKAYACDECRHEVGVVKAPACLFAQGLLERATAQKRVITTPLNLTGEVQFDERRVAHVSTPAAGIIKRVRVALGDTLQRGQVLLEIESVAVGEAQASYLEMQGLLELARKDHSRVETLRQEGISSHKELLAAQQRLEAAQIRADAARGKLLRLGMIGPSVAALTQATANGILMLRSPAWGTVLRMHAVAGEMASSESSLLTIGDHSEVWVWADLYERDFALVRRQQATQQLAALIRVRAFGRESFRGTLDFISPVMSGSLRTVKIRIAVPNPDGRLLAGMFADVTLLLASSGEAVAVPAGALQRDEGHEFVFVHHQGDYFVRRAVLAGRSMDGWTEIKQGLQVGATVVANGAFLMKSDVLRAKMGAGCAD